MTNHDAARELLVQAKELQGMWLHPDEFIPMATLQQSIDAFIAMEPEQPSATSSFGIGGMPTRYHMTGNVHVIDSFQLLEVSINLNGRCVLLGRNGSEWPPGWTWIIMRGKLCTIPTNTLYPVPIIHTPPYPP